MDEGWIKLYRAIQEHWVFKDSDRFKAWMTILMEVNHSFQKVIIRGEIYDCDIGQSLLSYDSWAKKFGKDWTKQKVRTFFSLLENDKMLTHEGLHYTTRVTVCNYKAYQSKTDNKQHTDNTPDNTPITHGQHTDNTPITPNKNDKKEKKEKKNAIQSFPDVVEALTFAKEKGLESVHVESWHESRELADWTKANGEKVKNWKLDLVNANKFGSFAKKQTTIESPKWAISKFKPMDYLND